MQSETQIRERQPNHRFVNFFELSGQELNAFANLVALNNGVVEIYIHPFFNANQVGNGLTSEKYGKEKAIEARISGRLADGQEKPRLIFEEDGYHEELESHFSDPNIKAIYVITKNNSAKPKHGEVDAVILIIQKLKAMGVTQISLAGSKLIKKWKGGKPSLEGCVGEAGQLFSQDFKISYMEDLTVIDERPKPQLRYGNE